MTPRPRTEEADRPSDGSGESGSTGRAKPRYRKRGTPREPRGQAHTLEGIVASLVVLTAVVFALEMTAVTPLSASTSSQHIENQQETMARGILGAAAESGALERAVLFWNDTEGAFHNTSEVGYYTTGPPPNDFGTMLNRSFTERGVAYNVLLRYRTTSDSVVTRRLVYQGEPSDNAVRAVRPVAIYQNDELVDDDGNPTGTNVSESSFYAKDVSDSSLHNVIRVEVIVWRI